MANTTAVCDSFKRELMHGYHVFEGVNPARTINTVDSFKGALYQTTATYNASTTAYSATGEVSSAGYTATGNTITNGNTVGLGSNTAFWTPSASLSWTGVSFTTDALLIYNTSQGNRAVAVFNFGSQTVTAGNFTLTMPTHAAGTGLVRIA